MKYTKKVLRIAVFMGIHPIKVEDKETKEISYYYNNFEKTNEPVPFYNTWNELMPVIEKIEKKTNKAVMIENTEVWGNNIYKNKSTKFKSAFSFVNKWVKQNQFEIVTDVK